MLILDKKQKIIISIAVIVILIIITSVIVFFIFNKKEVEQKPITLNYWGFDDTEHIQNISNKYKDKNKNITVLYTKKGSTPEEYQKILNDALAAGEGPDLFQIRNDWLPMNYKKMAEMPESVYSESEYKKIFYPIAYSDLSYKNKIYAVPFYIDTLALYFNKDKFKEKGINNPGRTWEDIQNNLKATRSLKGDFVDISYIPIGTSNNVLYSEDILYMIMLQNGTTMTSPDNKTAYFNLETKDKFGNSIKPGSNALNYYTSFANPTSENYNWNDKMQNSLKAFTEQKSLMFFGYKSDIPKIEELTKNNFSFEVSKAPQVLGKEIYIAKYWATGVWRNSKNKEEAWNFIKFATEKNSLISYCAETNYPCSRKDIAKNQSNKKYFDVFIEQNENAFSWNKGNWEETDKIFKEAVESINSNKANSQQAIDSAAKKITPILSEVNN